MTTALGNCWQVYSSDAVLFSLGLTAKICLYALILQLLIGVPLAWYLSGRHTPLRSALESLVTFPLIFPPIATGYLLLVLLGRMSFLGSLSERLLGGRDCLLLFGHRHRCFYCRFAPGYKTDSGRYSFFWR